MIYLSILKLAPPNILFATEEVDQEEDSKYKVEEILNSKELKLGQIKYFVK